MSDLRNIIRQLAQPDGETVALVCTVDEVDKAARTIDCTPINEGAPYSVSISRLTRRLISGCACSRKKGRLW